MKELLKKKTTQIGIAVIILVVAVGIISISVRSAQRQREYDGHVEAAEKYLTELDYEKAIAEYTMAFEIDPKEEVVDALEKTYLAYAQTFVDAGDYEKAVSILEEGYEKIGRESLQNKIEEFQVIQEETRAKEAQIQEQKRLEEEAGAIEVVQEEIKQLVESDEFHDQVWALISVWQYITDEQMRELCWIKIEILERYRELYPENYYYYDTLQRLYYQVGQYELCAQIREELHERYPDDINYWSYRRDENSETIYDEYGRTIKSTAFYQHGKQVEEYEYGQNGEIIRKTGMNDASVSDGKTVIETWTQEFEYDSEGRLSKATKVGEGWNSYIFVETYEYSEGGFAIYENSESSDGFNYQRISNFAINEYGEAEMVGDTLEYDF